MNDILYSLSGSIEPDLNMAEQNLSDLYDEVDERLDELQEHGDESSFDEQDTLVELLNDLETARDLVQEAQAALSTAQDTAQRLPER